MTKLEELKAVLDAANAAAADAADAYDAYEAAHDAPQKAALYYVSTPQGDSWEMSLDNAEKYYQAKVAACWANSCAQKKITMHKTVVVKQHTIKDTVKPPLSFY